MYSGVYDWHTLEGPFVKAHEGKYFCFYSGGRWEDETYGVDYAEASHPLGPWTAKKVEAPRVLRTVPGRVKGPGHNSITTDPSGKSDIFVYHAWDPEMTARRLCLDRLEWTDCGPRCAGPTWTPQII
jgi:GH43 family beta-xylosidase